LRDTYFIASQSQRIGLMGGSFNPAHEGHLHISKMALQKMNLDEVWWLVSPQNPLKPTDGMAAFDDRVRIANTVSQSHRHIRVSDVEARLGTFHTSKTLERLIYRFPKQKFVWIMGADNLLQIGQWYQWASIFHRMPVAIFARWPYSYAASTAKAAIRFARFRVGPKQARNLADMVPPAWAFFHVPFNQQSATRIRIISDTIGIGHNE